MIEFGQNLNVSQLCLVAMTRLSLYSLLNTKDDIKMALVAYLLGTIMTKQVKALSWLLLQQ